MNKTTDFKAKAETLDEAESLIVAFLGEALPETLTIMNYPAICEGVELGREVDVDSLPDSEVPSRETYRLYESALKSLVEKGKLTSANFCEMDVYALSVEEQDIAVAKKSA